MYVKELTNEEFAIFVNAFPKTSVYQTPEYALVMCHQDMDALYLGLVDNQNNIYGATLILIEKRNGFKYATAPRGFLIDYQNQELVSIFTKEVKKYLGKKDVIAVKISPLIERSRYQIQNKTKMNLPQYDSMFQTLKNSGYFHMGYNHYFEAMQPRFVAELKLNLPYYMLFEQLEENLKKEIRQSEQLGVKIYKGNENHLEYLYLEIKDTYPRDLNFLKQLYHYFDQKKQIEFYYAKLDTEVYLKETQNLYQMYEARSAELNHSLIMPSDKKEEILNEKLRVDQEISKYKNQLIKATNLLREYPKGLILSSVLIAKHKKEVYTLLDGYNKSMKEFSAQHLLMWKIIEKYSKLNYERFYLGGVANPELANNQYQELNDFKTSFHSEVIEYIGDLELITNNPLYFMYRNTVPLKNMFNK